MAGLIAWEAVPEGHRRRDYEYDRGVVRCRCQCRWRSTAARTVEAARMLWMVHIRSLARNGR